MTLHAAVMVGPGHLSCGASPSASIIQLLGDWSNNNFNLGAATLVGSNLRIGTGGGNDTIRSGVGTHVVGCTTFGEIGQGISSHDLVTNFRPGQDRINRSAIDANTLTSGNAAFVYRAGASSFNGKAGDLIFTGGVLMGDVNAVDLADFELQLLGVIHLTVNTGSTSDIFL